MFIDSTEKVNKIKSFAEEIKAQDILFLDVKDKTSLADYYIVCTGTSSIHVKSIAENVVDKMRKEKLKPTREEYGDNGWVLIDFGDVLLHVMLEENRQYYDLESLWQNISPSNDLL